MHGISSLVGRRTNLGRTPTDHPYIKHRSPESTQHYAKITPNTLAKAYNDAGYFARNVRTTRSSSTAKRSPPRRRDWRSMAAL
jgi:hypothetical protein